MQTDGNSFHTSLISFENSDNNNVMPSGFPSTLGESFIDFTTRRDTIRDFSTYPQISNIQNSDHFTGGSHSHPLPMISPIPISGYTTIENQEKLPPFVGYQFEPTTNYAYESLPFDATNTKWGFNKFPNEWITNELSLSLATSSQPSIPEQCSDMSSTSCSSNNNINNNLSLSFNSHNNNSKAPIQVGTRFLHAMQEILAEIACYALENFDQTSFSEARGGSRVDFSDGGAHGFMLQERDVEEKKKHLLALLQMVDEKYNQCLDEIHTVISAFHAVTELDPNVHSRFALPTISLMYKNLRGRISSQILAMGEQHTNGDKEKSFETSFIQKQWALQQLRKRDHQLWKPQRGLPERSVAVLRAWMFQNFLHPYPKDPEKHLLALKSGLTRSQVSNWFINARVRLWKPMIEEMYAEMNRRKARRTDEETDRGSERNLMRFENRRFTMD